MKGPKPYTKYQYSTMRWRRFLTGEKICVGVLFVCPDDGFYRVFVSDNISRPSAVWADFDAEAYLKFREHILAESRAAFDAAGTGKPISYFQQSCAPLSDTPMGVWEWSSVSSGIDPAGPEEVFARVCDEYVKRHEI